MACEERIRGIGTAKHGERGTDHVCGRDDAKHSIKHKCRYCPRAWPAKVPA